MANTYDIGDNVRTKATFTNTGGTTADPTTVTLTIIRRPSGQSSACVYGTDASVVRSTKGIYYRNCPITTSGTWITRWAGTTACEVSAESWFLVRQRI